MFLALSVYHKRFGQPEQHAKGQTMDPYQPCTTGLSVLYPVTRVNSLRPPFVFSILFSLYPRRDISLFVIIPVVSFIPFLCLISFSFLFFLLFCSQFEHSGKTLTLTFVVLFYPLHFLCFFIQHFPQREISRYIIKLFPFLFMFYIALPNLK